MLQRIVAYLCCLALVGCADHNITNNDPEAVILKASARCNMSPDEMEWLRDLLRRSETDFSLRGPIYAISVDNRMVFVHQLFVLSCLPCNLLDCNGELIDLTTVDTEKVRSGMTDENLIYNPSLE